MTQTSLQRRALLAAAGLALPALAFAQTAPPVSPTEAGPFRFRGWQGKDTDAERGFFEVPEDRRDPRSRKIRLSYVRFASTAARPGPPIIYLAGGPGGTATRALSGPRFPIMMALREVADVIAFDQRGTGLSNHIPERPASTRPPPPFTQAGLTSYFRTDFQEAWVDWTRAGVAMTGYNTEQNADDIDDLRRHLGAEKVDLWGISYGTHLALSMLKRHGDRVNRVALASLEGQDQTVKRPSAVDTLLSHVDGLLAADPAVRAAIPDLPALMRRVHARMEAAPVSLTATLNGAPVTLQIGGFAIQLMSGGLIANPQTLAMLPGLYLALDAGQTEVLKPFMGEFANLLGIAGMPEATDLASGISPGRLALVRREAKTAVLGEALNFPMPQLLGVVPGADLGEGFRAPLRIDHPALLLAGTLDGRTPMSEQDEVAAQFRRKSRVIVENAGHNVFEAHPDVQPLLVRFFRGEAVADTRLSLPPPTFKLG
ncbi:MULTISPECIES: alpha/beta hydrolase [unclassified Caulobacter]|uniref:alpha/beta hydrolase n=1 Tax=unclassified Caulobacter TaxID=2648921 RepID=UPI000D3B9C83|nr:MULTISPECIES: alpha/beta fold hydrolase [unclassified Caulobacter]PTS87864.1 alpha/beta hydrolase [Caulobacter sp. HMWF009]PTT11189.1 alpha/beta hydrolase [Caulobacter sp. HMWF025]